MMLSEDAILIDDSDEDEVVQAGQGGGSKAIVISDSEEEKYDDVKSPVNRDEQKSDGNPDSKQKHLEQNPFFYIDLTTRNLEEVESTDVVINDNPKILSMANVRKAKSSVQKKVKFNRGSRVPKNIDQYLLEEVTRVKAMEQEDLDGEAESDESISERLDPESDVEFWGSDEKSQQGKRSIETNERLRKLSLDKWKGYRYKHKGVKEMEEQDTDEENVRRPGKRVSKKQVKAKRRKKEQAREEKERNNPPKKESKKQARRRRQKERKLQEIVTIDLVGYEPTKEEILRKKSLEEMKRLEKAEIARITEKRKRDLVEMRMKGMRRVGSKAVAKRLITGHLGVGGKGQSSRKRREDRYCQELKEDKRRDNRRRKESNLRKLEEEGRAEGLARKLESNNKGFAMLVRMGYSPGDCLGKDQQGRLEPVTIAMRQGRAGLGSKET